MSIKFNCVSCILHIWVFTVLPLHVPSLSSFPAPSYLWTVSSCSLTMCASCWNIEPSSTIVLSMFCIMSARLWMYASYKTTTKKFLNNGTETQGSADSYLIIWRNKAANKQHAPTTEFKVLVTSKLQLLTYLFINELQLHGVALWVHIDGYIPQTPRFVLCQKRTLWRETKIKTECTCTCSTPSDRNPQ